MPGLKVVYGWYNLPPKFAIAMSKQAAKDDAQKPAQTAPLKPVPLQQPEPATITEVTEETTDTAEVNMTDENGENAP